MQREAHASVARERFTRVERAFAQLCALHSTHAPRQRQHNCAIVYDLPPNLEPRACLDSRVFGGNYGRCFHLEFTWYRSRFSGSPPCQRIAYWYFRAVCNNVSRKNICRVEQEVLCDTFVCLALRRHDNCELGGLTHDRTVF